MKLDKKLFKIINNYFPYTTFRDDNWKEILKDSINYPSVFHLLNTVRYYVSYFGESNSINLSIILYDNDQQQVGVMPLMVHKNNSNEWVLSSNGIEIVEPIFNKSTTNKVRKKVETKLLNLIFDLSKELKINKCQFTNMDFFKLSKWYLHLLGIASETFTTYHYLIDLSLTIDDIRLGFRKSFKPLINKGLKDWNVQVHDNISTELFEEFRLLHKTVAGKSTRPIESWKIQKKQIESNEAFLVSVKDNKDILIGAGLFTYGEHLGSYSVGVYKREYKTQGHAVQMRAIEIFKKKGLKWYEMGPKHLNIDKTPPSEKEKLISFFFEGFANKVLPRQHLIIKIPAD